MIALVVLAAVVAFLVWRNWPNEERRVRKQTQRLADCFSKATGESAAVMVLSLHGFEQLLGDQVELQLQNFPGNGSYSASEISSTVARVRAGCRAIHLVFRDVHVEFPKSEQAVVTLTARLVVTDDEGRTNEDTREVACRLNKTPDGWRFVAFDEITVLEK